MKFSYLSVILRFVVGKVKCQSGQGSLPAYPPSYLEEKKSIEVAGGNTSHASRISKFRGQLLHTPPKLTSISHMPSIITNSSCLAVLGRTCGIYLLSCLVFLANFAYYYVEVPSIVTPSPPPLLSGSWSSLLGVYYDVREE